MIPDGALSSEPIIGRIVGGRAYTTGSLVDYETGGVALDDASQGLQIKVWRAWIEADKIYIDAADAAPIEAYAGTLITEVSLAFDQNMRHALALVDEEEAKLNWYDTTIPGRVTLTFAGAISPRICMDDKRDMAAGVNDIILAYIKDGKLCYRQQRDRFLTEYELYDLSGHGDLRLARFGMGNTLRLQFEFARVG